MLIFVVLFCDCWVVYFLVCFCFGLVWFGLVYFTLLYLYHASERERGCGRRGGFFFPFCGGVRGLMCVCV